MKSQSSFVGWLWFGAGGIVMLACLLLLVRLRGEDDPASQVAAKTRRVEVVQRMESDLASASEAEKSAVLATTDTESQAFADQARGATARLEREDGELAQLLKAGGTDAERSLHAEFTASFVELRRIDEEVLRLAVQNTNVKAYALAFGPAAVAVQQMNEALSRLAALPVSARDHETAVLLAFGAETSALRIETLLPPHIAEESDGKMDALEALIATEDGKIRESLDKLAALPALRDAPDLAVATARYAEFTSLKAQILALSRANTNVRSLSLSLNQKRKAMVVCQAELKSLEDAIQARRVAGSTYGPPPKPR